MPHPNHNATSDMLHNVSVLEDSTIAKKHSRPSTKRPGPENEDRPSVSFIIEAVDGQRASVVSQLRDLVPSMEGAEERVLHDGFCRK